MSLLDEAMTECIYLSKNEIPDGYGGYTTEWSDGIPFNAAIVFDASEEARRAEKQSVVSKYTVTTNKSIVLMYHDVFRRKSDGKIFRVTSDGDDRYTPNSALLNMRQVSAEEWVLNG